MRSKTEWDWTRPAILNGIDGFILDPVLLPDPQEATPGRDSGDDLHPTPLSG